MQMVGHAHLGAALEQRVDKMRTDEPGTAGNDCTHGR
jgi:hypothetical protein